MRTLTYATLISTLDGSIHQIWTLGLLHVQFYNPSSCNTHRSPLCGPLLVDTDIQAWGMNDRSIIDFPSQFCEIVGLFKTAKNFQRSSEYVHISKTCYEELVDFQKPSEPSLHKTSQLKSLKSVKYGKLISKHYFNRFWRMICSYFLERNRKWLNDRNSLMIVLLV